MQTSRATIRTSVCTRRRVVKIGSSTVSLPFAGSSPDTQWTLPARQALQALQGPVEAHDQRLGERLASPHGGDEKRPGGQVGDVVLAQVDEAEAERRRVGPAQGALDLAGFRE